MKNGVFNNEIVVFAIKSLYERDVILKCLYWYGDKFNISVNDTENAFVISLRVKNDLNSEELDLSLYLQKLERDLIDFNLRAIVTKETANVRDLLIAKAFSNGEFEEIPPGTIADPVGFNVIDAL